MDIYVELTPCIKNLIITRLDLYFIYHMHIPSFLEEPLVADVGIGSAVLKVVERAAVCLAFLLYLIC